MLASESHFSQSIIERIRSRVAGDSTLTRSGLSREVCEWLNWRGVDGQVKDITCRVSLLKLARQGVIDLPVARPASFRRQVMGDAATEWDWPTLEAALSELGRVWLEPVDAGQVGRSKQWWAMLQAHHPLGAGPLCGAQLRYFVMSHQGVLGGLSFSAPAWRLSARDEWIGWDDATRQKGLSRLVANSRFLILPTVKVANLASHVLSLALSRLAGDWQARYGITPVLVETFVDSSVYRGTCYRAANWIALGQTRGRGRQDRTHETPKTVKDIWVYPLQPDWRTTLGANRVDVASRHPEPLDWAEEEFGACPLSDARLNRRLLSLARDFYARPTASLPQACTSRAKTKAAYRFLEHAETSMQTLLQSHYGATAARVSQERVVLAVQDTTSLDYTTHRTTAGLGPIGSWPEGPQGLQLHSTLAFSAQGTPLGFVDVQCWARDVSEFGKKARRHQVPIEAKESYKWLKSYRAVAEVQARYPNTTLVSVGDREADLYELFAESARHAAGPKLLVRAQHDRQLQNEQARLWQTLQAQPVAGVQILQLPRQGSRAARQVPLEIRYAAVSLLAPIGHSREPAIPVWAVYAQEQHAPPGIKPLSWLLLTTVPVNGFEEAVEKLTWYSRRWGIEVLHRTLKSGCRIEQRQLGHVDRLEACLAIDLVVAWRIYYLNKLGREQPDAPCTVYFDDAEWRALMVFTTQHPTPPPTPPTLREAIHRVAGLGGFLGRIGDGEPGTQTLWLGLQRLDDITAMWQFMTEAPRCDATQLTVSSRIDSG